MGLMDKLKNALFEEEYVEVEEEVKPVKKKEKVKKEVIRQKEEKPVAKKISGIKKKAIQEKTILDDDDDDILEDDDFDIPVLDEEKKESFKFPMMDEDDFKYEVPPAIEKPKIIPKEEKEEIKPVEEKPLYKGSVETNDYVSHEYGSNEKKVDKTYFKPSPVISPVYGVLDKNYRKEEVRDKKEVRLSTSFSRENLDVDEVRRKAFGIEEVAKNNISSDFEVDIFDDDDDKNLLVDLSIEKKPEVKTVTVGDAEEYYSDLGLEYNVDYKDVSKAKASGRRVKEDDPTIYVDEDRIDEEASPVIVHEDLEEHAPKRRETKPTGINSEEEENLFDLIDSMYDKD